MTKFKSQICTTVEQSERLLGLGLKRETADLHYCWQGGAWILYAQSWEDAVGDYPFDFVNEEEQDYWEDMHLPAWSLHRLWKLANIKHIILDSEDEIATLYDEVIKKIEQFIKEKSFNKEYLKEENS